MASAVARRLALLTCAYGPTGVYVKARGMKGWKFAAWTSIYDRAAAAEAGFDPSPRSGKVITRGRSSFQHQLSLKET